MKKLFFIIMLLLGSCVCDKETKDAAVEKDRTCQDAGACQDAEVAEEKDDDDDTQLIIFIVILSMVLPFVLIGIRSAGNDL